MLRCQLFFIFFAGQLLAATPWHDAESDLRVLVQVPREGRCMQVQIPPDLAHYRGVRAVSESGSPLPAQAVIIGDKLLSVSVNHSPSFRGGFVAKYVEYEYDGELRKRRSWKRRTPANADRAKRVCLYLLPDQVESAGPPPLNMDDGEPEGLQPQSPVACALGPDTMVGRPATGREYRDLARRAERERPSHNGDWFSFNDDVGLSGYKVSRSSKAKQFMHIHLESNLLLTEARTLQVSLDNGTQPSAWYLFVNHHPYASWTESPPGDAVSLPPLALPAGIHPISFFVITRGSESIPQLRLPEGSQLLTPHRSSGLIVEPRKSVLTAGLSVTSKHRFAFDRTDTELGLFSLVDRSANLLGGKVTSTRLHLDGRVAEFADGRAEFIAPLRRSQLFELQTTDDHGFSASLKMPIDARFDGVKLLDADFDLLHLPTFLPKTKRLTCKYSLAWPADFPAAFIDAARVSITFRSAAGEVLAHSAYAIPASPFKRVLSVDVPAKAKTAEVALVVAEQPIAPVQRLRFAEFADADLAFRVSGDRLRIGDHFAILRPVVGEIPEVPDVSINRVAVVDDFIATRNHIADDISVTAWLDAQGLRSSHHPVLGDRAADLPHLVKYQRLAELLAGEVDTIVWAVGHEELAHGLHLRPFADEMRFVAAACMHAGKLPILVSQPANLGHQAEQLRPYALALKELAVTFGVPIVDLYSASLRTPDLAEHQTLERAHSATLNAAGREWVLEKILRAIHRAGS
jgi:hypothetical protein